MSQRQVLVLFCLLGVSVYIPLSFVKATGDDDDVRGGLCARGQESCYEEGYLGLTPLQQQGRDTWYRWTGGDRDAQGNVVGDQALWRFLAVRTHGTSICCRLWTRVIEASDSSDSE